MPKIPRQFRQGDVLLQPIAAIPAAAAPVEASPAIVLAEGEATGHAHAIRRPGKKVLAFARGTELYLKVNATVKLEHEEHATVDLEPGLYQVRRQTEVWLDEVRQVAD